MTAPGSTISDPFTEYCEQHADHRPGNELTVQLYRLLAGLDLFTIHHSTANQSHAAKFYHDQRQWLVFRCRTSGLAYMARNRYHPWPDDLEDQFEAQFGCEVRMGGHLIQHCLNNPDQISDIVRFLVGFVLDDPSGLVIDLNDPNSAYVGVEGGQVLVTHRQRVRDLRLSNAKRRQVIAEHGALLCESCGLRSDDGVNHWDDRCFEIHHRDALAGGERETRIEDLACLCRNCHAIVD